MTSDRGNSGGAEMQLSNTPVTPKTPGLNPNALEFQSKTPVASAPALDTPGPEPPDTAVSSAGQSAPGWADPDAIMLTPGDEGDSTSDTTTLGYVHINGDDGKLAPGVISFPPTPDSPDMTPTATPDFTTVNGTMPAEILFPSSNDNADLSEGPMEGTIPDDQLRAMLKTQLEYYFSRENLANDSYLVSQMDADQYVPITTVAGFNQVKRLTVNATLVVQILRESPNVQVDETGEKVRPLHKRCVVILREIPDTTPLEEVERLFSGANCPRFVSCEFAHNNSWYVTFEGDEDAQRAYQYLREDVRTFLGRPIMARIKAKPLLRSTFMPKNGFKQNQQQFDPNAAIFQQQQQPPQQQPAQQQAPTQPAAAATGQRFTYTQVPNTSQYTISQQSYPFFPPTNTMMHSWANPLPFFDPGTKSVWTQGSADPSPNTTTSTTTTAALDSELVALYHHLSGNAGPRADHLVTPTQHDNQQLQHRHLQAFAANGYTPTNTYKQPSSSNHRGYQNVRNRGGNQNNKPHSRNQGDRTESRPPHERHGPLTTTRSSPRSEHQPHSGGSRGRGDRHGSSHSETSQNSHSHSSQGGGNSGGHQHHPHQHHHQHHQPPHHHNHHHHHPGGSHPAATPSPTATPTSSSTSATPAAASASVKEGPHTTTAAVTTATVSSSSTAGPHALPASSTGTTTGSTTTTSASADVSADTAVTAAPSRPRSEQHVDPAAMRDKDGLGPRRMDRYRSRRRRDEDVKGPRSSGPHTTVKEAKPPGETPKFELESTSFPPLPGSTNKTTTGEVFENKMSDVVKGTAKALTREVKTPQQSSQPATPVVAAAPTPAPPAAPAPVDMTPTPAPASIARDTASAEPTSPPAPVTPPVVQPVVITPVAKAPVAKTPVTKTPTTKTPVTKAPGTTTKASTPGPAPVSPTVSVTMATVAKTTVSKAPVAKTMATTTAASIVKEKTPNPTVNGLSSVPTPPLSPQRPVKQASVEIPPVAPVSKSDKSETPAAVPATPVQLAPAPTKQQDDGSLPVRLSYAQMVQRTKEREAERQKEGGDAPAAAGTEATAAQPSASCADKESVAVRAQGPLREQTQTSQRSPTRAEAPPPMRKDREDFRLDQRLPARRAKENRDRRGETRLPDRDSRDRFRRKEPRVEGEPPRVLSK